MGVTSLAGGPCVTPFIAQSHALWAPINLFLVLSLSNSINEYVDPTWQDEFTINTSFYYLKYKKVHIIRSLTPILTPISKNNHKNAFCISNLVGKEVLHVILVWLLNTLLFLNMWRPSWISRIAQGYQLDIRQISIIEPLRMLYPSRKKLYPLVQGYA